MVNYYHLKKKMSYNCHRPDRNCEKCKSDEALNYLESLPYTIHHLLNYPNDGNHQEILGLKFPIRITKGESIFHPINNKWMVYIASYAETNFKYYFDIQNEKSKNPGHAMMFKDHEKAYKYAKSIYIKWLKFQLKRVSK